MTLNEPKMFYFGPWDRAGHHFFTERGNSIRYEEQRVCPWQPGHIDGKLQPDNQQAQGEALVHHLHGWTALSFWDRSVDHRMGCNSTYLAEGTFTFDEMVEMARTRFAERWIKMGFPIVQA